MFVAGPHASPRIRRQLHRYYHERLDRVTSAKLVAMFVPFMGFGIYTGATLTWPTNFVVASCLIVVAIAGYGGFRCLFIIFAGEKLRDMAEHPNPANNYMPELIEVPNEIYDGLYEQVGREASSDAREWVNTHGFGQLAKVVKIMAYSDTPGAKEQALYELAQTYLNRTP